MKRRKETRGGARAGAGKPPTGIKRKKVLVAMRLHTARDIDRVSNKSALIDAAVGELMARFRTLPLEACSEASASDDAVVLRLTESARMPAGWTRLNPQTYLGKFATPGAAKASAEIINQLISQEIPRICEL